MFRYTFCVGGVCSCPRCHGNCVVKASWDIFYPRWNVKCVINTCWFELQVFARMGEVWSTHLKMHFSSSLARDLFGQHMFRYILWLHWHVEMHLLSSLTWEGYGQHLLRSILRPCWNGSGLVNTWSDSSCVLSGMKWIQSTHVEITVWVIAGLGWIWSTHVEIHLVPGWHVRGSVETS